jgi:hypothetical protein
VLSCIRHLALVVTRALSAHRCDRSMCFAVSLVVFFGVTSFARALTHALSLTRAHLPTCPHVLTHSPTRAVIRPLSKRRHDRPSNGIRRVFYYHTVDGWHSDPSPHRHEHISRTFHSPLFGCNLLMCSHFNHHVNSNARELVHLSGVQLASFETDTLA